MLFCLASDVVETEFLFIFVQINKGKQLFIPLADRGTSSGDCLIRVWLLSVLCYASTLGLGQARARDDFPVHGSLRPALRGSDSRFFVGNKAARSLFRGGVRPLHYGRDFRRNPRVVAPVGFLGRWL